MSAALLSLDAVADESNHPQAPVGLTRRRWSYRPPPHNVTADDYRLCKLFKNGCPYGPVCVNAHSNKELDEWCKRDLIRQEQTYNANKSLAEIINTQLANDIDEHSILKSHLEGVDFYVDKDADVTLSNKKEKSTWIFTVTTKDVLMAVTLLDNVGTDNFSLDSLTRSVRGSQGIEHIVLTSKQEWKDNEDRQMGHQENCYIIQIGFGCESYGTFQQRVVMSFKCQTEYLCRTLRVVVRPEEITVQPEALTFTESKRWESLPGVEVVRASSIMDSAAERLLKTYTRPEDIERCIQIVSSYQNPSSANYKEFWHSLLYIEESEEYHEISKYKMSEAIKFSRSYKMESTGDDTTNYALSGQLFGRLPLGSALSEDTVKGRIILQNVNFLLLATPSLPHPDKVFECEILDRGRDFLMISVPSSFIRYAQIQSEMSQQCQVQFVVNRLPFCEMHSAIDKFSHLPVLYPDMTSLTHLGSGLPPSSAEEAAYLREPSLNGKQNECLAAAVHNKVKLRNLPPVLLIGPFGTGKTKTFATSVIRLLEDFASSCRILICTLSNSAADLYIKDYLDPYCKKNGLGKAKILRIYYKHRWISSVSETVREHTLFDEETHKFRDPTWKDIRDAKVVIVTLKSCFSLTCLDLPKGFFTHIMVDEAAQAMELETLIPLVLADENTKVFLAGDHMQINPENVFSSIARKYYLNRSLFERLTNLYPDNHPSKIVLDVNYRSHEALVKYSSQLFYNERLIAGGNQQRHPDYYPLTFLAARGESKQHNHGTGYINLAEMYETVDFVDDLFNSWPVEIWGEFQENSIGVVVPYMDQVTLLRTALKQRNAMLRDVTVERVYNVQGKQFRVIIINAVRTIHTCINEKMADYGFLSNPKLLNTAVTRAQSLVAIVGDPFSLCSVGKCRSLWIRFLEQCSDNHSLVGVTFAQIQDYMDYMDAEKAYKLNPDAHEFVPAPPPSNPAPHSSAQQVASLIGNPIYQQRLNSTQLLYNTLPTPYLAQNQATAAQFGIQQHSLYGAQNQIGRFTHTGSTTPLPTQPYLSYPNGGVSGQAMPQQHNITQSKCRFLTELRESWLKHTAKYRKTKTES